MPSYLPVSISDNWKLKVRVRHLIDILDPLVVRTNIIGTQSNHLDVPLLKLSSKLCERSELRSAYGCEVGWVREEDGPGVSDLLLPVSRVLQRLELGDIPMSGTSRSDHE